jgi:hypothetical protein
MNRVSDAVVDALVQRVPVDWPAAFARARTEAEASSLRSLRDIAALAGAPMGSRAQIDTEWYTRWPLFLSLGLSMIVVVGGLSAFGVAQLSAAAPVPVLPLIVVLSFAASGLALLNLGQRDLRVYQFGAICLLVSSAFSRPLLVAASAVAWPSSIIAGKLAGVFPEMLLPTLWWGFARRFPVAYRLGALDLVAQHAQRLTACFGGITLLLNVVVSHALVTPQQWMGPFLRTNAHGPFWVIFYALTLPAIACIAARASMSNSEERHRTSLFGVGLLLGTLPIALAGILQVSSKVYQGLDATGAVVPRMVDALVWIGLISLPITTAVAIGTRRALPLRWAAVHALHFVMARNTLRGAFGLLFTFVVGHLVRERNQPLSESLAWVAHFPLLTAGLLLVAWLAHRRLTRAVDRAFKHAVIDYELDTAASVQTISAVRVRTDAAAVLCSEVQRHYPGTRAIVLVKEGSGDWTFIGRGGFPLRADTALLWLASSSSEGLSVGPSRRTFDLLPDDDQMWILRSDTEIIFPIGTPVWGILALGPRADHLAYDRQDRAFISTLACAASAAESSQAHQPSGAPRALECPSCGIVFCAGNASCACGTSPILAPWPKCAIGKFEIHRRVGAGGMGVVYAATDILMNRRVAMKRLHIVGPERVSLLLREARAMASASHPHLAQIYSIETILESPTLVVEWMSGGTLADRVRVDRLDWREAIDQGIGLAGALDTLHQAGYVHQDIKPSNLGFGVDGRVKLLDFGLSTSSDEYALSARDFRLAGTESDSATASMFMAGTPLYLAPELFAGAPVSPLQDLWALSLVLYEAIAGCNPFRAATMSRVIRLIRSCNVPDIRRYAPVVPREVADFFAASLSRNPSDRPDSAATLKSRLTWIVERGLHEGIGTGAL